MINRMSLSTAWLLTLTLSAPVWAIDLDSSRWSLDGFGTLGLVYSDTEEAEFIRDISQGEGVNDGWSAEVDSRLGVQLGYQVSDALDLIGQVVSRHNHEGRWDPELTWAFVRYQPDPGIQLRLGRVGIDNYMMSDSKDVGFSYLWVRPPVDYYGNRHLTYIDGADISFKRPVGPGLGWVKLYGGHSEGDIATTNLIGGSVSNSAEADIVGGQVNYLIGPWHFQVAHSQLDYQLDPPAGFEETVEQARLINPPLANALSAFLDPVKIKLWSAGVVYSEGPVQFQAAYTDLDQEGEAGDTESGFMTFGYRLGDVTPYITGSAVHSVGTRFSDIGLPFEGSYGMKQQTVSVGARYDFTTFMAAKFQLDRINVEDSGVLWRNAPPGWNDHVTLFNVSLDFVF